MSTRHDVTAIQIAKKFDTSYNRGCGPDVFTDKIVVEVVSGNSIKDAFKKLNGWQLPVYMAGATEKAIERARLATKGTNIGVMDQNGKIIKRSSR